MLCCLFEFVDLCIFVSGPYPWGTMGGGGGGQGVDNHTSRDYTKINN